MSNNYNWKGGDKEYCSLWNDRRYKSDIRERNNNNVCQNPYCFNSTKKLNIHHIDYDKKNCHPSNLITSCVWCNSEVNYDRS